MRVDVRVWWPREVSDPDKSPPGRRILTEDFAGCNDDNVKLSPGDDPTSVIDWYHVVYLSTSIRVNQVRR